MSDAGAASRTSDGEGATARREPAARGAAGEGPRGDGSGVVSESPPRLADGLELVGRFEDSGFKDPPFIARRADAQVVQMPEMLYRLAEQVDGRRGYEEVAERMSEAIQRDVDADAVRFLADEKLRPLGVLAGADGSSPRLQKLDPLLALKFKAGVVPERVTRAFTTVFRPLFWPPVVIGVVLGMLTLDGWLLFRHGIAASTRQVIYNPALLLMLLGAVVVGTAFHEVGHATACRYGGASPGKMGVGIYIIWPVFYTDVTDAYRLGRWGRLRTDLGGIYFNAIFALAFAAIYFATGFEALLLVVLLQNFAMVQQLLPFIRLDGYYVISDLTGVPDMFSRIKPALQSLIPGRGMDPRVAALKPWVRRVVAGYVGVLVPLVILVVALMAVQAPRIFATAYDSVLLKYDAARAAFGGEDLFAGVGNVLGLIGVVLPALGVALTGGRIVSRAGRAGWRWSEGEPRRRTALLAAGAVAAGAAAFLWWPDGDYRPIQPRERGTLQAGVGSLGQIPSGRPALSARRAVELDGAPFRADRRRETGRPEGERSTTSAPEAPTVPVLPGSTAPEDAPPATTGTGALEPVAPGARPPALPGEGPVLPAPLPGSTTTTTTTRTTTTTTTAPGSRTTGGTTAAPGEAPVTTTGTETAPDDAEETTTRTTTTRTTTEP